MANNFPYNLSIPAGPNNPSSDQPLMQTNTNSIANILKVDHFGLGVDNGGWHQQSTYPVQTVPPATTVGQIAFYSKADSNGSSQIFYIRDNSGIQNQLTTTVSPTPVSNPVNGVGSITYYSFLPGGLKVITGFTTNSVNGSTIDLSGSYSSFLYVGLTPLTASTNLFCLVSNPLSVNPAAGTMVILLRDTNNNVQATPKSVYFYVVAV